MAAPAAVGVESATSVAVRNDFAELERQQLLLASRDLHAPVPAAHVGSLERRLAAHSETLRTKCHFLDVRTSRRLEALRRREVSIDGSFSLGLSQLDSLAKSEAGRNT
uniref:Uncharacterized protein n=1 Tax=Oryza glumipatula TaxID=40148 RepID=A0A0D9ZGF2_9ORYZ